MKVSKSELSLLKKFQYDLDDYDKKVIQIYKIVNHHEYLSDSDVEKHRAAEVTARRKINASFGRVEELIYSLLGAKPYMIIPALPGHQWDVFAEALSSNFHTSSKGDCLEMARDSLDRAVGKAEGLVSDNDSEPQQKEKSPPQLMLVKSSNGRKYIVQDNKKHYIPDSETKNALGLDGSAFVLLSYEKLEKLQDGENIQSVKSPTTRLVRTKQNHDNIFVLFLWPSLHRRHIPDQATLTAMHRRQDQVEVIGSEDMRQIPEKDAINPSSKWDPKIMKSQQQSSQYINNYYGTVGTTVGSNAGEIVTKQRVTSNKPTGKLFQIFIAVLTAILALAVGYVLYRFHWQ